MSFQQLDVNNRELKEGRSCIIICNFNGKQLTGVKNFASIIGIKDQIILSHRNGESKVKDVINGDIIEGIEDGVKERAIVFNNISQAKMNVFIENLKKIKINNVLMASVTEISIDWTINILISNLIEERRSINSGKTSKH